MIFQVSHLLPLSGSSIKPVTKRSLCALEHSRRGTFCLKCVVLLFFVILSFSTIGCVSLSAGNSIIQSPNSSIATESASGFQTDTADVELETIPLPFTAAEKKEFWKDLMTKYNSKEFGNILALNRIDFAHRYAVTSLVVPRDSWSSFLQLAPFPIQVESLIDIEKIVVFSYRLHAFAVYDHGTLLRWGPTSMGKKSTPSPTGLFSVNWKKKLAISTVDPSWKLPWNVNIHNTMGIGWHQYALPGYHASHGCLRLLMEDAEWLYDFAETPKFTTKRKIRMFGTPVVVVDQTDFITKPWLAASSVSQGALTERELTMLLDDYLSEIRKHYASQ